MRISDWSSDVCSSDLVIRQSRAILEPLRDKEVQMRADAAGLPFDQVKAMSFSDQKLIKDAKGDPVGLTGDDYAKHAALTRGLKAMDVEVKGRRGAGQEEDVGEQASDQIGIASGGERVGTEV